MGIQDGSTGMKLTDREAAAQVDVFDVDLGLVPESLGEGEQLVSSFDEGIHMGSRGLQVDRESLDSQVSGRLGSD